MDTTTSSMQLQFLGATGTVTGSKYLLQSGESKVLIDCGLFQGYKQLRLRNWQPLPVDVASIHSVVLTHAHIDHSGYLPLLVKQGFRGKIYCSAATFDLCRLLLLDCAHLFEEEAQYANHHHFSKHAPALPLYTQADARECLKLFHPVPYEKDFQAAPGLTANFTRCGHILGAACVRLDNGSRSILFSGDLGRHDDVLLKPPAQPAAADYVVVESTYGNRLHKDADVLMELAKVINRTAARAGVVLIPAFAVGRAQNLLLCIHQLKTQHVVKNMPVYLNSPMAASATEIYHRHHDELRLTAAQFDAMAQGTRFVQTPEESRILNTRQGPMIIIAASGMATGGRVLHHLKAFAPDKRNTILFSGFQAGGTRGDSIVSGASTVRIHGEDVRIRAEVAMFDHLSAHADAKEILAWLDGLPALPKKIFITHGEPAAADTLRQRIERELHASCHVPFYQETVSLD